MSPNAGEAQLPRCSTPITPCDGVIANANLQLGVKRLSPGGQTPLGPVGCLKKIRVVLKRGEVEANLKNNTNMLVTPSTSNGSGCCESVSSESLSVSSSGDDDWAAAFKKGIDGKHLPYWISDAWNLDARDVNGVLNRVMKCKSLWVENPGSFARLLLVQQRIKEGCMAQEQPSLLHFCLGVKQKIVNVNEKQMMNAIKGLLRLGLDPNAKDRKGNTPLHLAVSRGGETCFVICLALIHAGASIDTRNTDGKEPFEGLQASVHQPSSHPDHKLSLRAVETLKQQRSRSLASLAARELWTPVLARIRRRGGVRTSELQETFGRGGGVSRTAEEWARHYNQIAVANEIQILGDFWMKLEQEPSLLHFRKRRRRINLSRTPSEPSFLDRIKDDRPDGLELSDQFMTNDGRRSVLENYSIAVETVPPLLARNAGILALKRPCSSASLDGTPLAKQAAIKAWTETARTTTSCLGVRKSGRTCKVRRRLVEEGSNEDN